MVLVCFAIPPPLFVSVWESVSLRLGKEALFLFFPWAQFHFYCGEREEGGGIVFRPEKRAALFGAGNRMISSSETFYCSWDTRGRASL